MFLNKKYILANEIVEKMEIHIANISMLRQNFEKSDDYSSAIKMNNCTFIKRGAHALPNNIRQAINDNEFVDMSDKLPCTYVRSEYGMTEREMRNAGIVIDKVKISGKSFYVFPHEFVEKMKDKVGYILGAAETMECQRNGEIDGYTRLSGNKYFVWY